MFELNVFSSLVSGDNHALDACALVAQHGAPPTMFQLPDGWNVEINTAGATTLKGAHGMNVEDGVMLKGLKESSGMTVSMDHDLKQEVRAALRAALKR